MIPLAPRHLKRYKDIALLLVKHQQRELVHAIGLDRVFQHESEAVHDKAEAEEVVADLERLGPTFIKLGQLLSTRTDLLPAEYLKALSRLQDRVGPMPFDQVSRILDDELGPTAQALFGTFDQRPLASASIGQVHRATLLTGERVVVKVQRPGVREAIFTDLEVLGHVAEFLDKNTDLGRRYRFGRMLQSLRRSLVQEVNYTLEAANAARFAENLRDFPQLSVPRPYVDLTTDKVLTLEFVAGKKLPELSEAELSGIDGYELARQVFRCYLRQVLIDGFFHADPHPGNVFVTPDGRIALIDFGMVVNVPEGIKGGLSKLVLALSEGDGRVVAQAAIEIGRAERDFDADVYRERVSQLVADYAHAAVENVSTGTVVLELQAMAGEAGLLLPTELTMLGKVLMHLDQLMVILSPGFVPSDAIREYAGEIVRERSAGMMSLTRMLRSALEAGELAQALPYRLNRITEMIAENRIKIDVDAVDEKKLIASMEKIANRVTTGLVLAALIIGASLVLHIDSPVFRWIAIVFFVLAGGGGLWLVWRSFRRDVA